MRFIITKIVFLLSNPIYRLAIFNTVVKGKSQVTCLTNPPGLLKSNLKTGKTTLSQ